MLKTQHLRFLVAVVDYGSAIKAAERLHISQPTISAGLKALEEELGGGLFDRSGPSNRPLRLTLKGQRFYQRALNILEQCESALEEFAGQSTEKVKIILGVIDTLPQDVVVDALLLFKAAEPNVSLNWWEGSSRKVTSWFSQERLDIVWNNVGDLTPNAKLLWRERLVAVVNPDHPYIKTAGTISIRDLAKYPFIHRSRCELDPLGQARLKGAGVKLNVQGRVEREDLAFRLVKHSQSFTLAPEKLVPPGLISVEVSGLNIERNIGLQWQVGTPLRVISALTSAIEQAVGKA
ncbi:LysR family transcriptional regulator [Oceanospirillum maris]|uniref:LysR family transcriptional regulator n=1 Tax=Oceanospirillum maris TaxID=64977 RepID=UPI0003FD3C2E|nr:LysR family transcriptional regulator [Oceanospirillum maris]